MTYLNLLKYNPPPAPQRRGGIIFIVFLAFAFASCNSNSDKESAQQVVIPEFNPDSAYHYVAKQVDFGPRVPNSAGHKACGNYLISTLKKLADTVYVQEVTLTAFDETKLESKNIIASFNPQNKSRILLAAHWDTRPFADQDQERKNEAILGANDGGSGVGVLLEIARVLSLNRPTIGIDIVLFDSEDYGQPSSSTLPEKENSYCLGSQYWSKNPHVPDYTANFGILLDMVGGKDAVFTKEGISMQYAKNVVDKVWKSAVEAGQSNYFSFEKTHPITDDHYYVNTIKGIPTIDIIHYDSSTRSNFPKTWHTHSDNIEGIDKNTLKAVGQTLLQVIYSEK